MNNLHKKRTKLASGYNEIFGGEDSPLKSITLGRVILTGKENYSYASGGNESAIVLMSGKCDVNIQRASGKTTSFKDIARRNPFEDAIKMFYIAPHCEMEISATSNNLDLVIAQTPSQIETECVFIDETNCVVTTPGAKNWKRKVVTGIGPHSNAGHLLVGETFNPPGNWSSYPPHKHDEYGENGEVPLEEAYFYLFNPPQGFGMQRVYTAFGASSAIDEAFVIQNGDAVAIPRGYHPVVAGGGYELYYLWVLAGEKRLLKPSDDPAHQWIKNISD